MKKWMWITVLAVPLAAGSAWAQPPGGCGMGRMQGMGGPACTGWIVHNPEKAKELGVTDDQVAELRDIAYKARLQTIKLRAESETARVELEQLMSADQPDEAAILKAVENAGRIETEIQKARVQETLRVRAMLGEEQVAKLRNALCEQREERRGDRKACRGKWGGHGGKSCPFMGGPGMGAPGGDEMPPPGAEPSEEDE